MHTHHSHTHDIHACTAIWSVLPPLYTYFHVATVMGGQVEVRVEEGEGLEEGEGGYSWGSGRTKKVSLSFL